MQHSAGSGKSNTIAWLAHRLSSLHAGDEKVFDKVVVITDRVVLDKGERRLTLYRDGRELKNYRVSLGLRPTGHKQQEGDYRTPEGSYRLTRRNPDSEFFLSIQVSYPDAEDLATARKIGVSPGGLIMIHGLPNIMKYSRDRYLSTDWTDGCIALSNAEVRELWQLIPDGTPIEIRR